MATASVLLLSQCPHARNPGSVTRVSLPLRAEALRGGAAKPKSRCRHKGRLLPPAQLAVARQRAGPGRGHSATDTCAREGEHVESDWDDGSDGGTGGAGVVERRLELEHTPHRTSSGTRHLAPERGRARSGRGAPTASASLATLARACRAGSACDSCTPCGAT